MSDLARFGSGRRSSDGTVAVWRIAERQWGVVALWQMLDAGIGRATVARWSAAGRLHRLYPGVYAVGHRRLSDEGWLAAALLYAGRGAALSHLVAGWWLRIIEERPSRIAVSAPGRRSSLGALDLHHPRTVERVFDRGLPVTPPARTLLNIAPLVPPRQLLSALAETFYLRLAAPEDIRSVLGRGHAGSRALRAALDAHVPQLERTKSELEDTFVELCERHRLPMPEINAVVEGHLVDAVWKSERVVVELDSELAHGVPGAVQRDRDRDLALRRSGWAVLRYSWKQVLRQSNAVAADLARALAGRSAAQESAAAG